MVYNHFGHLPAESRNYESNDISGTTMQPVANELICAGRRAVSCGAVPAEKWIVRRYVKRTETSPVSGSRNRLTSVTSAQGEESASWTGRITSPNMRT